MNQGQAPGKVVLLGEYAVLHGAPALAASVAAKAIAVLEPADAFTLSCPDLGIENVTLESDASGVRLHDAAPALDVVAHALAVVPKNELVPGPWHLSVRSDGFWHHSGHRKLGLGSSAAVTVAVLRALHADAPSRPVLLERAVESHRSAQGGAGSGIDIGVSVFEGLIRFEAQGARVTPWGNASGLAARLYASRDVAHTSEMLKRVAHFQESRPKDFDALLQAMTAVAERGLVSLRDGDSDAFLDAARAYGTAMEQLGAGADIPIVTEPFRLAADAATPLGLAFKPSGAGGGDVGVAFGHASADWTAFDCTLQTFDLEPLATSVSGFKMPVTEEGQS